MALYLRSQLGALIFTGFALVGCDTGEPQGPAGGGAAADLDPGEVVYRSRLVKENGQLANTFTCQTCHALEEPAEDGIRRAGHQLGDAFRRPHFKNGQLTELRDAVNSCVVEWMGGDPLAEDDQRWIDLRDWLKTKAPTDDAPALTFEITAPPADLEGGSSERGRNLFNQSCNICHGVNATGTERAPHLIEQGISRELVARRVRTSGSPSSDVYPGLTGGRMPFFAADRLSDGELRDLMAYVESLQADIDDDDAGMPPADDDAGPGEQECPPRGVQPTCPQTHPLVGTQVELTERAHDVRGSVCVVDDCSVLIRNFSYNGGGINVQVYGASCDDGGCDFDEGFSMSEDILGDVYTGDGTLSARLPEGKTLDDLEGISIWCVAAGVSFGDARVR